MSQTSSAGKTVTPTWLQRQGGIRAVGKGKEDMQTGGDATFIHKPHRHTTPPHTHTQVTSTFWTIHNKTHSHNLLCNTSSPAHLRPCLKAQGRPHAGYTKMNQRRIKEIITFPSFLPCQYAFTIWKHRPHPLLNKRGAHLFSHGGSLAITRDLITRRPRAISKFIVHGSSPSV